MYHPLYFVCILVNKGDSQLLHLMEKPCHRQSHHIIIVAADSLYIKVQKLAFDKAASVIRTMKDSADGTIVIGSDTVVVFENVILGKPHDTEDAVNTLKKLQANTHQVYTGVSVWEKKEKVWTEHTFYESTDVTFYPVSDEEIREYVATGEPMDKAGAYGIQGGGALFCQGIEGDYYNVMGLPVCRLGEILKKAIPGWMEEEA